MYHNLKFGDFEVFPNFWCLAMSDELPEEQYKSKMYHCNTDKEEELYIKERTRVHCSLSDIECIEVEKVFFEKYGFKVTLLNNRADCLKDLSTGVFSTYNGKGYDNKVAKCLAMNFTNRQLYLASQLILEVVKPEDSHELGRIANYVKWGWDKFYSFQDFMDDSFKGLKDKEASYGLDIRETTVPFGKEDLTYKEMAEIIFYNMHDVYSLHVHYSSVARAYVDTKVQLCEIFGLDKATAYKCTNAVLSGKVLGAERVHGTTIKDTTITVRDEKLNAYFTKHIPADVYKTLLTGVAPDGTKLVTTAVDKGECVDFTIYENTVSVGDGGLHSEYILPKVVAPGGGKPVKPAIYVESTEEWAMFNIDASSCYTSVMIYCDAISRSIRQPERLREIYNRRMKLKATPKSQWTKDDKYFVAAAKLVLNTTYGAMGNKYLQLFDEYMRTKTCRIGQMVLIALANALYKGVKDLRVLQNNTDGVLVYAKRAHKNAIQSIVDEFSEISHFIFEVEEDKLLWQLNVNNYLAIDPEDHMKDKGGSFVHDIHQPGYYHIRPLSSYIIPKAQIDFYRNKSNPIVSVVNNTKVSDFCMTCTKGGGYYAMVQFNKDGITELGKVARAIAVIDKKLGLVKKLKWFAIKPKKGKSVLQLVEEYKKDGKKVEIRNGVWKLYQEDTCALCPPNALIVNDALYNYRIENRQLIHADGRKWNIDYAYYARELDKALNVPWFKLKNESLSITKDFNL